MMRCNYRHQGPFFFEDAKTNRCGGCGGLIYADMMLGLLRRLYGDEGPIDQKLADAVAMRRKAQASFNFIGGSNG